MLNSAHLSAGSINFAGPSFNKHLRSTAEYTTTTPIEKTVHKPSGFSKTSELTKREASFDRKSTQSDQRLEYSSSSDLSNLDLLSPESEMASPPASDGYDLQKMGGHSHPSTSNLKPPVLPSTGVSRQYSPMFIQQDNFSSPFTSSARLEGTIDTGKKDIWSSSDFSDISPPQLSLDFLDSGKSEALSSSTQRTFQNPHQPFQRGLETRRPSPISRSPIRHVQPRFPVKEIEAKPRERRFSHVQLPFPVKEIEAKPRERRFSQHEVYRSDQRRPSRYVLEGLPPPTFRVQSDMTHHPGTHQDTSKDFETCLTEFDRLSLASKKEQHKIQDKLFASSRPPSINSSSPVLVKQEKAKFDSPRSSENAFRDFQREGEIEFQDSQSSESDEDSESSLLATQPLPNLNLELEEESMNPRSWQAKRGLLAELYKTEICLNWLRTRNCSYGNKCHYAHGIADLRARQRIETYKTQPCADPARKGCHICMYTTRCNYAHPGEPIRRMGPHSGKKYFDHEYFEALRKNYPYHEMPFGVFV
eukprot:TRINITY_DN7866_c0_g1_i8.p1 TRINITY_DN7866_c0_g1~~TRINITY_DN7866_c0_g1_i8.p1  ORF type:complete len:531 (-),score=14.41 TRINITY_DN7866_c0_g1_i8:139-1731(-)